MPAGRNGIFAGPDAEKQKGRGGGEGAPRNEVKSVWVGVSWVQSRVNNHA